MQTAELTLEEMADQVEHLLDVRKGDTDYVGISKPSDFGDHFKINGRVYRIYPAEKHPIPIFPIDAPPKYIELPDLQHLRAFVFQLDKATERLCQLQDIFPLERFPIELNRMRNFGSKGVAYIFEAGTMFVHKLVESAETESFLAACLDVQSQWFHELIHRIRINYKDADDRSEVVPLLGEFLYDPKNNTENEWVKELPYGSIECGIGDYTGNWITASKLLLWELKQLNPDLKTPDSLEGQMELIAGLQNLYVDVLQEQRDNILAKYLPMEIRAIEQAASDYAKELNLKF